MNKRIRTMRVVGSYDVERVRGWADAALVFKGYSNIEEVNRVTIAIRSPQDVAVIRQALNDITVYWAEQLRNA